MSGATNCPETPRQKMIGMMYLVLTAMLALNVSADILNGFLMVDNSLISSIETSSKQTSTLYEDMEYLYKQNPEKVGEWLEKSNQVRMKSDSLIAFIHQIKADLMMEADKVEIDPDTVNAHKLVTKDNTDIASRYFIGDDPVYGTVKGQQFKKMLEDYRHFMEKVYGNDSLHMEIYEKRFSTSPSLNSHGTEEVSWLNAQFESMPIIAVTTQLSKYESDVYTSQMNVLQYLKAQTDAGDFRVNKIQAFVIPDSRHVIRGDQYKAKIMLAAIDSTKEPEYYVESQKLPSEMYSVTCNSTGIFPFSGKIVLKGTDGVPREYPFSDEYTVGEQTATIANEDMNVVYRGYENRLNIAVPGVASENIIVEAKGAQMIKPSGKQKNWICRPTSASNVELTVYANTEDGKKKMATHIFRTLRLPNPSAFLAYADKRGETYLYPSTDKEPTRDDLLRAKEVVAQYADGMLQANFTITGFTIYAQDATGGVTPVSSNSSKLTASQVKVIKGKKRGSRLVIEDIRAKGPDGVVRDLSPISIAVK